jgi:prevent-host-death family protein
MTYSIRDAKAKFSEVVDLALTEGAQTIARDGENIVVVVPYEEYQQLTAPRQTLADFFLSAPRAELDVSRVRGEDRKVDFE